MTDVAIVTTTINYPVETLRAYASVGELIVVGDLKTPPETMELVRGLDGIYLTPTDQQRWYCSDTIGWNCIQRRNIGFLEAYRLGHEVVITIDDDNVPTRPEWWREHHVRSLEQPTTRVETHSSGWYNPGHLLTPQVHARGFPYLPVDDYSYYSSLELDTRVGVNCGLWLGDPDVDAIQRIAHSPMVEALNQRNRAVVAPGVWSPVNSQNTAWRRELLPLTMLPPGIGRWDDILGGYVAQWSMWAAGYAVAYGEPVVHQDRNEHNLWTDLRKEIDGLEYTMPLCDQLDDTEATGDPLTDLETFADFIGNAHDRYPRWPLGSVARFVRLWIEDWKDLL